MTADESPGRLLHRRGNHLTAAAGRETMPLWDARVGGLLMAQSPRTRALLWGAATVAAVFAGGATLPAWSVWHHSSWESVGETGTLWAAAAHLPSDAVAYRWSAGGLWHLHWWNALGFLALAGISILAGYVAFRWRLGRPDARGREP